MGNREWIVQDSRAIAKPSMLRILCSRAKPSGTLEIHIHSQFPILHSHP